MSHEAELLVEVHCETRLEADFPSAFRVAFIGLEVTEAGSAVNEEAYEIVVGTEECVTCIGAD